MNQIAVVNASTVVSDADLFRMTKAWQIQVSRDFTPNYGQDAVLLFVPHGQKPPPNARWVVVSDDAPSAGYLGYHDRTSAGMPMSHIFAGTDLKYGTLVSVTGSHEILEMQADPNISLCVQHGQRIYAYECGDPVEADSDGYDIDLGDGQPPVRVSNFILPTWFETALRGTKYDFLGQLTRPRTLRPGGYCSVLTLGGSAGWTQIDARTPGMCDTRPSPGHPLIAPRALYRGRALVGSRRERRRTGEEHWLDSTVATA